MRRSSVKAAAFRMPNMLVAIGLAVLLALAVTLAGPVTAQEETTAQSQTVSGGKDTSDKQEQTVQGGSQQAEDETQKDDERAAGRATGSLQGAAALIINDDAEKKADRVEIDAAGCEVEEKGATVTVDGQDGGPITFTNGPGDDARGANEYTATIESVEDQVIVGITDADLPARFGPDGGEEEAGTVTSSTNVACGRDAGAAAADADDDDGNGAKDADDLDDLSCDELLVLFRGESSSELQYVDATVFADSEVRAQVEVCLEREIVEGTAADEHLPDTGGPSLLALAVLGVFSAAAGLSVIRGGRR